MFEPWSKWTLNRKLIPTAEAKGKGINLPVLPERLCLLDKLWRMNITDMSSSKQGLDLPSMEITQTMEIWGSDLCLLSFLKHASFTFSWRVCCWSFVFSVSSAVDWDAVSMHYILRCPVCLCIVQGACVPLDCGRTAKKVGRCLDSWLLLSFVELKY